MPQILKWFLSCSPAVILLYASFFNASFLNAGQLYVGGATVSITPDQPVALEGQRQMRIAKSVASPCTATAVVIERRDGDQSLEQVIFVSCDLVCIRGGSDFYGKAEEFYKPVREQLQGRLPESLIDRLIINATHTHTGPLIMDGRHDLPSEGVMQLQDYRKFLFKRLGDLIVQAWENREPAQVAWGLGHAVVAQNRRAVYADGTAVMHGKTNQASFRGIEGYEDHGVEILYFWNAKDELIATAINIACPAQEASGVAVDADFWHPVREQLRKKYGEQLLVLAWAGAAGDQATAHLYRRDAELRMRKLRGLNGLKEWARRITATWEDVYEVVKQDRHSDVTLKHQVKTISLPEYKVTDAQVAEARKEFDRWSQSNDPVNAAWHRAWHGGVVDRYERQQKSPQFIDMRLHAVQLGDVAIVTNEFELFTDYGVQIKARSPALQTFVIQLCGSGTYLPTTRALSHGGYSAIPQSNKIGPEGGQILVEETLNLLNEIWKK